MSTRVLVLKIGVVFTHEDELEGVKSEIHAKDQAARIAARYVWNQIIEQVPDDCKCSLALARGGGKDSN